MNSFFINIKITVIEILDNGSFNTRELLLPKTRSFIPRPALLVAITFGKDVIVRNICESTLETVKKIKSKNSNIIWSQIDEKGDGQEIICFTSKDNLVSLQKNGKLGNPVKIIPVSRDFLNNDNNYIHNTVRNILREEFNWKAILYPKEQYCLYYKLVIKTLYPYVLLFIAISQIMNYAIFKILENKNDTLSQGLNESLTLERSSMKLSPESKEIIDSYNLNNGFSFSLIADSVAYFSNKLITLKYLHIQKREKNLLHNEEPEIQIRKIELSGYCSDMNSLSEFVKKLDGLHVVDKVVINNLKLDPKGETEFTVKGEII